MTGYKSILFYNSTINPMTGEQHLAGNETDAPESISVFSRAQYKAYAANVKQKAMTG
jgi:hypothetical protein